MRIVYGNVGGGVGPAQLPHSAFSFSMRHALRSTALIYGLAAAMPLVSAPAQAQNASQQSTSDVTDLRPVVVTSTRTGTSPFATPASVDVVDGEAMRDSLPQINLSESLGGVPGLLIQNRQNYAQDLQIAIRGFGS